MESPWVAIGLCLAVFLLVSILGRIVLWAREIERWTLVSGWDHDNCHSGTTSIRVRLPAPGYRVCRRGSSFRAERLDASGGIADRFRSRKHLTDSVQDCWDDFGSRSPTSSGTETLDSELVAGDGNFRTA
jgi:hypothetical protein